MTQAMTIDARVRELHDRAVTALVEGHKHREEDPLVLAVRFDRDEPLDVGLLEILDGFPGGDDNELLSSAFEPSAQLRILGALNLVLGSPEQLRAAVARDDSIVGDVKKGVVVHDDGSTEAAALRRLLGL